MAKVKKNPRATAEGQQPDDNLADLNDLDTDIELEDDKEIDRQEESDSNVKMIEVDMMRQAFIWVGLNENEDQDALRSEITELQDMNGLTERDISYFENFYANRPRKTGGIFFGLQRTKKIKSLMHWVQDFTRVIAGVNRLDRKSVV